MLETTLFFAVIIAAVVALACMCRVRVEYKATATLPAENGTKWRKKKPKQKFVPWRERMLRQAYNVSLEKQEKWEAVFKDRHHRKPFKRERNIVARLHPAL